MYKEEWEYIRYAGPQILDRQLHVLEGILKAIVIDNKISHDEVKALLQWCSHHQSVSDKSPFHEIIHLIKKTTEDGIIDEEEKKDIIWLCEKYTSPNAYYDKLSSDMQRLHGILAGIAADGEITEQELTGLKKWIINHKNLKTIWPFDEIDSLITEILNDGIIDDQEHYVLLNFCNQFLKESTGMVLDLPIENEILRTGVCSTLPDIQFQKKIYCITGTLKKGTKNELAKIVIDLGGSVSNSAHKQIDYLIVGAKGSECWAFTCYGRKIEAVMNYRKEGSPIQIVHEFDFWDAVQNIRAE